MSTTLAIQLVLMVAIFYFLMIRPQQQRSKKEKAFEAGLKSGDKVITKSGIHGKVTEISEDTVVIETMAGKIKMERSSISSELTAKNLDKK
jgi:preprotein translocase subunit YajC